MSNLVYFASGFIREEYQNLNFDKIYLIDNCFKNKNRNNILSKGKITCIGLDCLESIEYLKKLDVQIDCFVSLNEGLSEGGGSYAINSDMFLGFAMPLFKERYIHIMNQNYYKDYPKKAHVSMDLPFNIEEIKEDDGRYLSPYIFSKDDYHIGHAKVFQMSKVFNKCEIILNSQVKITILHDSIWNYQAELESLVISFSEQGQRDIFDKLPRVINMNRQNLDNIFNNCVQNKIKNIGFTPWGIGNYRYFIEKIKSYNEAYPKEIFLYHLNKNDYKQIKTYC